MDWKKKHRLLKTNCFLISVHTYIFVESFQILSGPVRKKIERMRGRKNENYLSGSFLQCLDFALIIFKSLSSFSTIWVKNNLWIVLIQISITITPSLRNYLTDVDMPGMQIIRVTLTYVILIDVFVKTKIIRRGYFLY